jgi:hypothetical protein
VLASACLALAVQMIAFAMARLLQPRHLLLGWGLGSVLRLVALVLYAIVVAKLWRAPITPALLSFVAGVGLQFAVTIVAFALAGIWLDRRLGTSPWFVLMVRAIRSINASL